MLLEYSISNYKVFKDEATLSFVNYGRTSNQLRKNNLLKYRFSEFNSASQKKEFHTARVGKLALIYGPNGGGKTTLIQGLFRFIEVIGVVSWSRNGFAYDAFLNEVLNSFADDTKPIKFYISVATNSNGEMSIHEDEDGYIYDYEIEIIKNDDNLYYGEEKLVKTLLKSTKNGHTLSNNPDNILTRKNMIASSFDKNLTKYTNFINSQDTGNESSILAKLFNINPKLYPETILSEAVVDANVFKKSLLSIVSDNKDTSTHVGHNISVGSYADQKMLKKLYNEQNSDIKKSTILDRLQNALKSIDYGITKIEIISSNDGDGDGKQLEMLLTHGTGKNKIEILLNDESDGTIKFISQFVRMSPTFINHGTFVLDEIETHYHPEIQKYILGLFLNDRAQLIATTHNLEHLTLKEIPTESYFFIEKDLTKNVSKVNSMIIDGIPNRDKYNFKTLYESGRLGAFPRVLGSEVK